MLSVCPHLIYHTINLNDNTGQWNESPLHKAAIAGKSEVVNYLLQHGAVATGLSTHLDVQCFISRLTESADLWKETPSQLAQDKGHAKIAEILRAAEERQAKAGSTKATQ
jgi:ankyrin repeat protein